MESPRGSKTMDVESLDFSRLEFAYLKAAFMAMEPADCIITLAKNCGGGSLTEDVQNYILEHCIKSSASDYTDPNYVRRILKKLISTVESTREMVIEGLYEQLVHYISSLQDHDSTKERGWILKHISFFFEGSSGNDLSSRNFSIPLKCSVNLLEGDTGCVIWPSSMLLSEFILSNPNIFSNKICLEVGSGVGLVGLVLNRVKASEVILSDGDLSTLANMKLNIDLNNLDTETALEQKTCTSCSSVKCKHLPWETASEKELETYKPDLILGADVIYNPSCIPHLIRILSTLLVRRMSPWKREAHEEIICDSSYADCESKGCKSPTAYIATVIRNIETFNYFVKLAGEAHLTMVDITETSKPLNFLSYMLSYDRANVRLYKLFFSGV